MNNFNIYGHTYERNKKYLPPFLGGPIDEIYKQETKLHDYHLQLGPNAPLPKIFQTMGIKHFSLRGNFLWYNDDNYPLAEPLNIYINRIENEKYWICVENVPDRHFMAIFRLFLDVGTVANQHLQQEKNCIYLKYEDPNDSQKALYYNDQPMYINEQIISVKTGRRSNYEIMVVEDDIKRAKEKKKKSTNKSNWSKKRVKRGYTNMGFSITDIACTLILWTCLFYIIYLIGF